jgi:hypothetical protein
MFLIHASIDVKACDSNLTFDISGKPHAEGTRGESGAAKEG